MWKIIATCGWAVWALGCWDTPVHEYDKDIGGLGPSDTAAWETLDGFGDPCSSHEECQAHGYPLEARCIENVLNMINTPGGYCTACCDKAAVDGCRPGIDCVGADNVYLVCLARCHTDADCRQSEGYECRKIYYIADQFPGNYCLPNQDLVEPPPGSIVSDIECNWPWNGN